MVLNVLKPSLRKRSGRSSNAPVNVSSGGGGNAIGTERLTEMTCTDGASGSGLYKSPEEVKAIALDKIARHEKMKPNNRTTATFGAASAASSANATLQAYNPPLINEMAATQAHVRYNTAMAKLLSDDDPLGFKPSLLTIVWPIYGTPRSITDLSVPAIAHFISHLASFRCRLPLEDAEDYEFAYRQHVARRAYEEGLRWDPEVFGKKVVGRVMGEGEREVVRRWVGEVERCLSRIVAEVRDGVGVWEGMKVRMGMGMGRAGGTGAGRDATAAATAKGAGQVDDSSYDGMGWCTRHVWSEYANTGTRETVREYFQECDVGSGNGDEDWGWYATKD